MWKCHKNVKTCEKCEKMRFENAPGKNVRNCVLKMHLKKMRKKSETNAFWKCTWKKMCFENVKKCEKMWKNVKKCGKIEKNTEKWEQKAIEKLLFLSSIFHFFLEICFSQVFFETQC